MKISCDEEHLGDCVAPEGDVPKGKMRETEGDYVQETLDFMDDCVCEGEGFPVLHSGTAVLSNHSVNLLLHFLCTGQRKGVSEGFLFCSIPPIYLELVQ